MPPRHGHDTDPPPHWPDSVTYLTRPRLSPSFPKELIPLISSSSSASATYNPKPIKHPSNIQIKRIETKDHPACGQHGLFAKSRIKPGELIIPYLGIIHATITPESQAENGGTRQEDEHESSDYDLSLLRISSSETINPFPGNHISIGIDASKFGNSARFVNDYRGINDQRGPNAEFKLGKFENGELRMEIWSLNHSQSKSKGIANMGGTKGIEKGDEILVSYGKGWWGARKG